MGEGTGLLLSLLSALVQSRFTCGFLGPWGPKLKSE